MRVTVTMTVGEGRGQQESDWGAEEGRRRRRRKESQVARLAVRGNGCFTELISPRCRAAWSKRGQSASGD